MHICDNTHIMMLSMDYDMLSILFCLEILGSCKHELNDIILSFDRRSVLVPRTNIFDLSNNRKHLLAKTLKNMREA